MSIKTRKVAILGAGHVGSHVAFALATQGEADELYLVDIDKEKAYAQARDVNDAVSYLPHHVVATACEIEDCKDCDLMYIAVAPPSCDAEDRLDLLAPTIEVIKDILPRIKKSGFKGIIINISNPADVIAAYIQQELEYDTKKIISTGTALDSSRLQLMLSEKLKLSRRSILAYAMGEHGNSAMVPWSHVKVAGQTLDELHQAHPDRFPLLDKAQVLADTKYGGNLVMFGKGSTEFGIATCSVEIARAIFHDEYKILPCSCYLDGEYGQEEVFASVPTVLCKDGVDRIIEITLTKEEQEAFEKSCDIIREFLRRANEL